MTAKKIIVIANHDFRDKHTKDIHRLGDIFGITKTRFDEIVKTDESLISVYADESDNPADGGDAEGGNDGAAGVGAEGGGDADTAAGGDGNAASKAAKAK